MLEVPHPTCTPPAWGPDDSPYPIYGSMYFPMLADEHSCAKLCGSVCCVAADTLRVGLLCKGLLSMQRASFQSHASDEHLHSPTPQSVVSHLRNHAYNVCLVNARSLFSTLKSDLTLKVFCIVRPCHTHALCPGRIDLICVNNHRLNGCANRQDLASAPDAGFALALRDPELCSTSGKGSCCPNDARLRL